MKSREGVELDEDYRLKLKKRLERGEDEEGARSFLTAVLFQEPPPNGWPTGRDIDANDDKPVTAISALDPATAARLTVGLMLKHVPLVAIENVCAQCDTSLLCDTRNLR